MSKEFILSDLHEKTTNYNSRALNEFQKMSQNTADIYMWKKSAKEKEMTDF